MGSTGRFLLLLERRKRISIENNATSASPPRTQPTMIPTSLDNELWAAEPEVPVDEGPKVDGDGDVVLSGSLVLG